jgi:ABC-2 type transport system ATP-binding protein
MIRVTGLTKDYGSRRAIDEITFDANRGEILGFLGPNGAGKTTTMRILTGFLPPTSGKAEIGGYDVIGQSLEVRRIIGYLPETVPLYPDMTVYEYLKFMANIRRVRNAEDRIIELLELVHMEDRADGYIEKLSKGMRQRVGIAQALLHEPEVLILDEPTIGLDPAQIYEVRNLIREIGRERTVLLSTHILSEAQQICNRVLIINKGRIVAEDTPEQLQSRLTGSNRIAIQVRGEADNLAPLLLQIPGVLKIYPQVEGNLELEIAPGIDVRPDVAQVVVNTGYDLIALQVISMSLEEIFLELTRDEVADPDYQDHMLLDTVEEV